MKITFYGAAGGVTGSKHLLETGGKRILLDCGLFQGLSDVRERNRSLPFAPESIDAVVISHAHLDHCGMLTLLVKRGFKGPLFATPATIDVVRLMLTDAAEIEVQDAAYRKKHHIGSYDEREPLFTPDDVAPVMEQFQPIPYTRDDQQWTEILPGVSVQLYDAGHILGSAVIVLRIAEEGETKTVGFTGDLGQYNWPLLRDPQTPHEPVETMLVESTYGNREHKPLTEAIDDLIDLIHRVYERKGKIICPAFALGRTQGLVYVLHELTDSGKIPRIPTYVDSPLAVHVSDVFRKYGDYFDERAQTFFDIGEKPLSFSNLTYIRTIEESKALNLKEGPSLIIASSGMMTAGRVIHHLKYAITDPRNAVIITGYQAVGTTGRQLLEGHKNIELHGQWFPVKAEIAVMNEFSAHADRLQLTHYLEQVKGLKRMFLVHGEPQQADRFKEYIQTAHPDWHVYRPSEGDSWDL